MQAVFVIHPSPNFTSFESLFLFESAHLSLVTTLTPESINQ